MNNQEITERLFENEITQEYSDYLLWGFMTLWVFILMKMRRLLFHHINKRGEAFLISFKNLGILSSYEDDVNNNKKFIPASSIAYIFSIYAFISFIIAIGSVVLINLGIITIETLDIIWLSMTGTGGVSVGLAIVLGLHFNYVTIKQHEHEEARWLDTILKGLKKLNTSAIISENQFWVKLKSSYYLFGMVALLVAMAPFYATWHVEVTYKHSTHQMFILTLAIPSVLILFSIIHIFGVYLFIKPYNRHIEIESGYKRLLLSSIDDKNSEVLPEQRKLTPGTELAVIMFTDVVGFSQKMEMDEEKTMSLLEDHFNKIRLLIKKHHGIEIKTIGDAILMIFKSATDAVKCAINIQQIFGSNKQCLAESEHFVFRIGVHLGDVIIKNGDVFGDGVNIAARIEKLADPGGICISENVYNIIKRKCFLKTKKLENIIMKNIKEAPVVYQVLFESASSKKLNHS